MPNIKNFRLFSNPMVSETTLADKQQQNLFTFITTFCKTIKPSTSKKLWRKSISAAKPKFTMPLEDKQEFTEKYLLSSPAEETFVKPDNGLTKLSQIPCNCSYCCGKMMPSQPTNYLEWSIYRPVSIKPNSDEKIEVKLIAPAESMPCSCFFCKSRFSDVGKHDETRPEMAVGSLYKLRKQKYGQIEKVDISDTNDEEEANASSTHEEVNETDSNERDVLETINVSFNNIQLNI